MSPTPISGGLRRRAKAGICCGGLSRIAEALAPRAAGPVGCMLVCFLALCFFVVGFAYWCFVCLPALLS